MHTVDDQPEFHSYTRGRFVQDEAQQMRERYVDFSVHELAKVAAQSVQANGCVKLDKFPDGQHCKAFLLTMDDAREVVAKLPNPEAGAPHHTTASEVATMRLMRELGIPVPEVYSWCSHAKDTPVKAEYIIMEKAQGIPLEYAWKRLDPSGRFAIVKQLIQYQATWLSVQYNGYGSIYFKGDTEPEQHIPIDGLEDFVLGPTTGRDWNNNGRYKVTFDRGPWTSAAAYFQAIGNRELKCIEQMHDLPKSALAITGPNLYETSRERKAHAVSIYLKLLTDLIPSDPELIKATAWHPDLHSENIFVDPQDPTKVTALIDWQSTVVTPLLQQPRQPFLLDHAGQQAQGLDRPQAPANMASLTPEERITAKELSYSQAVAVAYRRWIKAKHPLMWKAAEFANTFDSVLLLVPGGLLVDGEAQYLDQVVDSMLADPGRYSITLNDLGLSSADLDDSAARAHAADAGMDVMAQLQETLGSLFPEKGIVTHEEYDDAKRALKRCKAQLIEKYAKNDADRLAWEKAWPFDP